jgi:hypothetical protein
VPLLLQELCKPERERRFAGAAGSDVADNNHWNTGARQRGAARRLR